MSDRLYSDPDYYVRIQKIKVAAILILGAICYFSGAMDPLLVLFKY